MSYLHIANLYRKPEFLDLFKNVYCLEKIHGTSAHIKLSPTGITFFSGGASHEEFVKLFDQDKLFAAYKSLGNETTYTIFGEAYGGKMQGMSDVYGKELKFVAFDVQFSNDPDKKYFMDVPQAAKFVENVFGLEFVAYNETKNDLRELDIRRDLPSTQSVRNIQKYDGESEGIIVRPIHECLDRFGARWIVKHKKDKFRETTRIRSVSADKLETIESANAFADEYVTEMRLSHVLDKIQCPHDISITGKVVLAMLEDIKREMIEGEIEWNKEVEKSIGKKTAELYKINIGYSKMSINQ